MTGRLAASRLRPLARPCWLQVRAVLCVRMRACARVSFVCMRVVCNNV